MTQISEHDAASPSRAAQVPRVVASPPRRRGIWRWTWELTAVASATFAVVFVIYQPWGSRVRLPISYGQDATFFATVAKNIAKTGSYHATDRLGAPYGQELYTFPPGGDRFHHLVQWVISRFTSDGFLILNLYYWLSFVAIAIVAFIVLRNLRVGPLVAGGASVLYSVLPYHFWRTTQHLPLTSYYAVPLVVLLAFWIIDERVPLWRGSAQGWSRRDRRIRLAAVAGCAALLGSTGAYYAVFGAVVVAGIGLLTALRRRRWTPVLMALPIAATIVAVLILCLVPEIFYRMEHGPTLDSAQRSASESMQYGLNLTQMVTPAPGHRVGFLSALGDAAAATPVPNEGGAYLGLVGVVGFVVGSLSVLVRGGGRDGSDDRIERLGSISWIAVLLGVTGGVGFALAVAGFTWIRSWNRVSVFIAFTSLAVVAVLADRALARWSGQSGRSPGHRLLPAAVVLIVTAVGAADQVPTGLPPDYETVRSIYGSDQAFFGEMSDGLDADAMVFQLPMVYFPEHAPWGIDGRAGSYDHLRGYLLGDDDLRWSAGGTRGTESDWQEGWVAQPTPTFLRGLVAAGFDALYVDTLGYQDRGAELDREVRPLIGPPAGESGDGRLRWYDLRDFSAEVRADFGDGAFAALGEAVLRSVRTEFQHGLGQIQESADGTFRSMSADAAVLLVNAFEEPQRLRIAFRPRVSAEANLHVSGSGFDKVYGIGPNPETIEIELSVPPGRSTLRLETDAPPQALGTTSGQVQLFDFSIAPSAVHEILDR
jgi:phosphoglycerol transferase